MPDRYCIASIVIAAYIAVSLPVAFFLDPETLRSPAHEFEAAKIVSPSLIPPNPAVAGQIARGLKQTSAHVMTFETPAAIRVPPADRIIGIDIRIHLQPKQNPVLSGRSPPNSPLAFRR